MPTATEYLIDCETLRSNLLDPKWLVIDCRFDLNAAEAGRDGYLDAHIPGAVYAHLDSDLSAPPATDQGRHPMPTAESIKDTFERLGVSNETQVIAYDDQGGMIAARIWWMLRYIGHEHVKLLDGGWSAWRAAGLPVQSGQRRRPGGKLQLAVKSDRLVLYTDLAGHTKLVDAREPRRFRGEFEPIDPRAGHIPGAKNHFFGANVDETKKFLEPAAIKVGFEQSLGTLPDEQTVHYCGSGVSACHNIFAQVYAGLPEPLLYGGSWSEWAKLTAESEGADVRNAEE
ncbi:MAG: sulfurtransferase [Gammaproteobacteria bacterium]